MLGPMNVTAAGDFAYALIPSALKNEVRASARMAVPRPHRPPPSLPYPLLPVPSLPISWPVGRRRSDAAARACMRLCAPACAPLDSQAAEVWTALNDFARYQWAPAASEALAGRKRRASEGVTMPGSDSENPVERLLASLATPAADGQSGAATSTAAPSPSPPQSAAAAQPRPNDGDDALAGKDALPSAASLFYGDDSASASDVAERRRRATWSLDGSVLREVLTSLFFTFALLNAAKQQWDAYPEDAEELERLVASSATDRS